MIENNHTKNQITNRSLFKNKGISQKIVVRETYDELNILNKVNLPTREHRSSYAQQQTSLPSDITVFFIPARSNRFTSYELSNENHELYMVLLQKKLSDQKLTDYENILLSLLDSQQEANTNFETTQEHKVAVEKSDAILKLAALKGLKIR